MEWHHSSLYLHVKTAIKILVFLIGSQFIAGMIQAEKCCQKNSPATEGSAQLFLYNHHNAHNAKDSVYITYDRYDRSGAGIIHEVFYPKKNHTISIEKIPPGKYFVTIQFLGSHHDRFEKVIKIRSNETKTIDLELQDRDEFSKANVKIPADRIDFSRLGIVSMK
jgi:hypothetical protein